MIFAVDIGNTNIVIGCIEKKKVLFTERISTNLSKTELEYAIDIKQILAFHGAECSKIEGCILSSVVPPLVNILKQAVSRVLNCPVMAVEPGLKTGLSIRIDNPSQLGSDLVAAAVAAIDAYPLPAVVIDMGTATTFSVINERRQFLGGIICPGVNVALHSLSMQTSQLPHISLEASEHVIGKNTIECMKSGAVFGNAAMVDGLLDRILDELHAPASLIATGGMARFIIPHCKHTICYDDDLLLKGLYLIYEKNKSCPA